MRWQRCGLDGLGRLGGLWCGTDNFSGRYRNWGCNFIDLLILIEFYSLIFCNTSIDAMDF